MRSLVITGSETDVCVLATALDAVDRGYRVVRIENPSAVRQMRAMMRVGDALPHALLRAN